MTPEPDFYAALGVRRDASQAEINHAYRRLLRQHHPDVRPEPHPADSPMALQRIVAAYTVLRDSGRRAEYDRHHAATASKGAAGPSRPERDTHHTSGAERARVVERRAEPAIRVGPVRFHGR